MPNIQVRDAMGMCYTIHSSDPELIGKWLVEQLRKVVSVNTTYNHPVYVDVWPTFLRDQDGKEVMDWSPAAGKSYERFQLDYEHTTWIISLLEQDYYKAKERLAMTGAKWCDVGGHAYPANDPGSSTISLNVPVQNQWGGEQISQVVKDCCSDCAAQLSGGFGELTQQIDREKSNYRPNRASPHRTRRLEKVLLDEEKE